MSQKIFFSWQGDAPTREGRNLVERALERAIGKIGQDTTLEEAIRELEIDQDTKDVPGSPPIVDTIFRKIDDATVFVPDLTFVGKRIDGRPSPNPNVLIEYGWALKSLGHGKIVPVMNTAFGKPTSDAMPFDMRHLRNPIQYSCREGASDDERRQSRETLASELERQIREVILHESSAPKILVMPELFTERIPSEGSSRFRNHGEALGVADIFPSGATEVKLLNESAVWLRLMPAVNPKRTWRPSELKKATYPGALLQPILDYTITLHTLRGIDGYGVYAQTTEARNWTNAVAYAFETGEVWSIDSYILSATRQARTIPTMEKHFSAGLKHYSEFLLRLGISPPFRWIAGMENLKGRSLTDSRGRMAAFRGSSGYCVNDVVSEEGTHHPDQAPELSLEPFFVKLFESCGLERLPEPG